MITASMQFVFETLKYDMVPYKAMTHIVFSLLSTMCVVPSSLPQRFWKVTIKYKLYFIDIRGRDSAKSLEKGKCEGTCLKRGINKRKGAWCAFISLAYHPTCSNIQRGFLDSLEKVILVLKILFNIYYCFIFYLCFGQTCPSL